MISSDVPLRDLTPTVLSDYNKADEDAIRIERQEQGRDERGAYHGQPGPGLRHRHPAEREACGCRPSNGRVRRAGWTLRSRRVARVPERALRGGRPGALRA